MEPSPRDLAESVRRAALARGFVRVGFTPVEPLARGALLRSWLAAGRQGEMAYLAEDPAGRADPRSLLSAAKTLVSVVASYDGGDEPRPPGHAFVARYARGPDYHAALRRHLQALAKDVAVLAGRPIVFRACVDTAPLLEREAAERAGVGFVAKNTLVISPGVGSYTLLGELLVDLELTPAVAETPRCGECRACLDACPTGALDAPFTLDARRCISYLTIELRGPIPPALRPPIGDMIFGCDRCQEVCPFNQHTPRAPLPELVPLARLRAPRLVDLLGLGTAQYRRFVAGTALRRVRRGQLLRNVAVALGNTGDHTAIAALTRSLAGDADPLVRGHAAWALGRLGHRLGHRLGLRTAHLLEAARGDETDPFVRDEIAAALDSTRAPLDLPRS